MKIRMGGQALLYSLAFLSAGAAAAREWTVVTDVGNSAVSAIASLDRSHTWAAPGGNAQGTILFADGESWAVQTSTYAVQTGEHRGAYALDSSHVWVVGNTVSPADGQIFLYNGSSWSLQTRISGGTIYIYDAFALAPGTVWAGGNLGRIYGDNGTG